MSAALEARVRALEERLAAVEAVQEIHNLKARYGELVDSRYTKGGPRPAAELAQIADEIVLLFSEDAVWDGGGRLGLWQGRAKIRERFLEPTLGFTLHYFVKPRIEVAGERARALGHPRAHHLRRRPRRLDGGRRARRVRARRRALAPHAHEARRRLHGPGPGRLDAPLTPAVRTTDRSLALPPQVEAELAPRGSWATST
jgi:hypothetical protein